MAKKRGVIEKEEGRLWAMYNADCVELTRDMPDNSVHISVYSPPFSQLFIYSESERDMGNCDSDEEFMRHYRFLTEELYRVLIPGREVFVHCSDLPRTKSVHGHIGLYDFPADVRQVHEDVGFIYHSRVTIWKDPVVEMQRTKALGLLHKQIKKDSTRSRHGMPDYVLVFRKPPSETDDIEPVTHTATEFPVEQWQQWASPVWMDINQTNVLNKRVAREDKDEKHICPLQLDLIQRCLILGSNPGDVVYSPFAGIGSEGYVALQLGRRFIGCELKSKYYQIACRNLREQESMPMDMFANAN